MARVTKWGVIPYRFLKGGGIEVLLITTKSKKWGLPKGNMIRKLGPSRTALVEAYEEAGIAGKVSKEMIQCMHKNTCLYLYPMLVTKVYSNWPEKSKRSRKWVKLSKAAKIIGRKELRRTLKRFDPEELELSRSILQSKYAPFDGK
jgi:hypothetical protein